jgi:DNA repair protein RadD
LNALAQADVFPGQPFRGSDAVPPDWLDVLPVAADCLRDYQRQQLAEIASAMHAGVRRILVQAPTGSGKTHLIACIVAAVQAAGLPVLVLATRTRLLKQLLERLEAFDVRAGVIAAAIPGRIHRGLQVQVASADTLHRRAVVNGHMPLPSASVVIFDEAHLASADTRLGILDSYPDAVRIGLTATPARKSGKSLGVAFDRLILGRSIRELTAAGTLVPTRIFNTPVVTERELRAVPKDTDSDYQASALGELLGRPKLVGDVVSNWLRIANRKRTLVFAVNKSHAQSLLDSFRREGVAAEMLTDQDDEATREEVVGRLERSETSIVVNCFLMSYGVDVPSLECIVLARPTRSLTMYLQMVGRGLRPSPETGKAACVIIDHGHVVESLGLPQSDFAWTLDTHRNVNTEALKAQSRKSADEKPRTCGQCKALWLTSEQGNACPSCGWTPVLKAKPIRVQDADLEELADVVEATPQDERVMRFFREACGWYARRWPDRWMAKASSGRWWAWLGVREKFKFGEEVRMPSAYWEAAPLPPSIDVSGWLQYRIIKYARGKAKARARAA